MTPLSIFHNALYPAMDLLPSKMNGSQALTMLIAIGLQESKFQFRLQIDGPARGYWQFERGGGVAGVLKHKASAPYIKKVLMSLDYGPDSTPANCYTAIAHNDILAAAFARLLLWTHPDPLPGIDDVSGTWDYYIECWRPGKPHVESWPEYYKQARELIQ